MSDTSERKPALLFTAFEPSGDDHAAVVIRELRARHPELPIYAWGGARMAAAGATIVHSTGEDAVMGLPGLSKIREHQRINADVAAWLTSFAPGGSRAGLDHRPVAHIPVDSPAANFPICAIARKRGLKVIHLVAPQLWAWGPWRIGKLRRLSDLVLCILPFEEEYFQSRHVPARFIGHPLLDTPLDERALDLIGAGFGQGDPKIALMPGSRPAEIRKNFPLLLEAFVRLNHDFPNLRGVVAATKPAVESTLHDIASRLRRRLGPWPSNLITAHAQTDAVIRWCDLALVVSGTVTLQIARQTKPMVILYKSNPLLYHAVARWVLTTKYFTLPNLISGEDVVPEFVPHFGGAVPIFRAARDLLRSRDALENQRRALRLLIEKFEGLHAGPLAADQIERVLGLPRSGRGIEFPRTRTGVPTLLPG
jgi:lipid-A-disaccharide synthase